jgi:hypothetical protein
MATAPAVLMEVAFLHDVQGVNRVARTVATPLNELDRR